MREVDLFDMANPCPQYNNGSTVHHVMLLIESLEIIINYPNYHGVTDGGYGHVGDGGGAHEFGDVCRFFLMRMLLVMFLMH